MRSAPVTLALAADQLACAFARPSIHACRQQKPFAQGAASSARVLKGPSSPRRFASLRRVECGGCEVHLPATLLHWPLVFLVNEKPVTRWDPSDISEGRAFSIGLGAEGVKSFSPCGTDVPKLQSANAVRTGVFAPPLIPEEARKGRVACGASSVRS